jgi:chaperone BCS1
MHGLVTEILEARSHVFRKKTDVYVYQSGWWRLACRKDKRDIETVVLPEAQKAKLLRDIERFRRRKQWYLDRGIPYRRGFLFEGPPGCGKTSLVMALAGHFSLPIYVLNLGSLSSDDDLFKAVMSVPENALLLIEDIDAATTAKPRKSKPVEPTKPGEPAEKEEATLTLSGLLNALDGTFSRDGRVLVLTTNHPENIDPALIRPGRADIREHIGAIEAPEVLKLCKIYLGDERGTDFANTIEVPIIPATLGKMLQELETPDDN